MHLAVLGSADSWYLRDLVRAAGTAHRVTSIPFSTLGCRLSNQRLEPPLLADAVLVRSMPPGSLEQVVFRMDLLARWEVAGTLVVNPPRAIEAAVDKFLASAKLQAAGLPIPRTICCQTALDAMAAFDELGCDVVVKPLFGSEGRGIARLQDEALALRAFRMLEQLGALIYLQEFIPHEGHDLRVLVVGQRVLGMRRTNPHDWRTNISRGARGEPLEVTAELANIAKRAADAVGAPLAGVDLLPGRDRTLYAIEVNAVPGWRALARVAGVDVARLVLEYIASRAAGGS
ncbi:MAG TPA: RimK family alpha-L-glutamate ligase [Pirellulales bacterium]|jgi:ribosomal protein S6--L-glutamate ligase|nr:RimK family alpha-L-glutamate ligase [Pirellulales bacterium]